MKIRDRILSHVIDRMRSDLEEAQGSEVLWVGKVDPQKQVTEVMAVARGNEEAVPALAPFMDEGDVVIHNHPSGVLKPSGPDLAVASRLGNQGIGFYIVDNLLKNVNVVAEPVMVHQLQPLSEKEIEDCFLPGGALSKLLGTHYETRVSQMELAVEVSRCFNNGGRLAGEAGTGVGKSFAYLLPSLLWTKRNNDRIVISTGTINLQQQLLEKDIPLVQKITGPIKAVLVKGRRNYLCHHRLEEYRQENGLFADQDLVLQAIIDWSKATKDGSISDLSFLPSNELWSRINSDPDTCLGLKCGFREQCFVAKAKREAASAQILIVNHHLLFSDLSLRVSGAGFENTAVLPPFKRIVIDEAHNIETAATSYFSESFSRFVLNRHLKRLFRIKGKHSLGVLVTLQKKGGDEETLHKIPPLIDSALEGMDHMDASLLGIIIEGKDFYLSPRMNNNQTVGSLFKAIQEFRSRIMALISPLKDYFESFTDELKEDPTSQELKVLIRKIEAISTLAGSFLDFREKPDKVFWIEKKFTSKGEAFYRYIMSPLEIGPLMKEALIEPFESGIFTSATLSIQGSFQFWQSRVGLDGDPDLVSRIFPSPFNYKDRVLLALAADAPEPQAPAFVDYVTQAAIKNIEISEGGALVLFTSYRMLQQVFNEAAPQLDRMGIPVYKQGDDDRSRLLERFKHEKNSVLFATDSFWEGVDTPGESLKLVIITRLPFRVPTEPILQARVEVLRRRGGNPFMELSLPEAVTKLKQGFGRLMRRSTDHGVVMILDPRIIRKQYGRVFLESLPPCGVVRGDALHLTREIEDFLYQDR